MKSLATAFAVITTLFLLFSAGRVFENVGASEVVVVQSLSGNFTWYKSPTNFAWQGLGTVTSYPRRSTYSFEIPVRFNDGGHGTMQGSIQWEMPLDSKNLSILHTQFGSADAIQKQLIETVVNKSVYMTGPLMSSKESYAEKRNYLINYVEDQIARGVYRTIQREVKINDPLTNQEKNVVVVDIVQTNGQPQRQEEAVLAKYGITTSNFSLKGLPYDPQVEAQIQEQQKIAMQVQTAIAESRQAEQRAITVEQQGRADAAQAKWAQEVIKAKAVTEAQQQLEVQTLRNQTAEQYRQEQLKKADGDAGYRRQVMQADGALQAKLNTYLEAQRVWASAVAQHQGPWVPSVVLGGSGNGAGSNGASDLINMLTAKTAQDLGLSLKPSGN